MRTSTRLAWMLFLVLIAGNAAQPLRAATYALGADGSGTFFDPAQDGHGMVVGHIVSNGEPALLVTWFTYLDGQHHWLVGVGPVTGNSARVPLTITRGGDFPPRFVPASVTSEPWGELNLRFDNRNSGQASWTTAYDGYASGSMPIQRLTQPVSAFEITNANIQM